MTAFSGSEITPFREPSSSSEARSYLPRDVSGTASISGHHFDHMEVEIGSLGFLEIKSFPLNCEMTITLFALQTQLSQRKQGRGEKEKWAKSRRLRS